MDRPTLRLGSGYPEVSPHLRDDVRVLQRELVRRGYVLGTDGAFGEVTRSAVMHFQRKVGLSDDGVVGAKTWRALLTGTVKPVGASWSPKTTPRTEPAATTTGAAPAGGGPGWMKFAKDEAAANVVEIRGKAANPRIVEYHAATSLKSKSDEVAWCSSFVCWCLGKAGVSGTRSAAAASWLDWGVKSGAKYGAITVIYNAAARNSSLSTSGNHVGFLIEETSTHFKLLGGNQSNSVKVSSFPKTKWRLKGLRWPPG